MNAFSFRSFRGTLPLLLLPLLLAPALGHTAAAQDTARVTLSTVPERLGLADAILLATRQSAGVQSAEAQVGAARARVTQARSALLPQIRGALTGSQNTINSATFGFNFPSEPGQPPLLDPNGQIIGPVRLLDVRASGTIPIYDYSARERVRASQLGVTAAGAGVTNAAEQAAVTAAAAYVQATRADATLSARLEDSTLAADLLTIARQQLAAGVGVGLDVTRAQSQLAGVRAQLIAARNDRDRARLTLLRALNLGLDTPLILTDSLGAPLGLPASDESAAVALAIQNRPELRALDAQLAVARQQVKAINAERLPSVGITGDDGAIGLDPSHLLNTYDVRVGLSVPLFTGFNRQGREQEQEAVVRDLEARDRDMRQQVAVDVRGAILDMASASEQADAARERLALAEQEVAQARERFRAGVAGNADVITASLNLTEARTQLVDVLTAESAARLSLARAEGTVAQIH
jgi:outer membrane protein TolC